MYEQPLFRVEAKDELSAFVRAHPLGLVIVKDEDGVSADLIPFLIDAAGSLLRAHFAKANPLRQKLVRQSEALIVFQGPQAYVSPGFYPAKAEHGEVVPTWNYAMVQARGVARLREEPDWIAGQIADLADQQERSRQTPWRVDDAPPDFIAAQMRAIVGLEIAIADLRGKFKLSQNRVAKDRAGVVSGLERAPSVETPTIAQMMRGRETGKNLG